LTNMNWALLK